MSTADTLAEVSAKLKALQAQKRKLQRQHSDSQSSDQGRPRRAKFGHSVAAEIFRATGDKTTASEFINEHWQKRCGGAGPVPAQPEAALRAEAPLHGSTLSASAAECSTQSSACEYAARWLSERNLAAWVGEQNVGKGLAPSNAGVWETRSRLQGSAPVTENGSDAARPRPRTVRARNQWLARWARRWGLQRGAFQSGEVLNPEELKTKASFVSAFSTVRVCFLKNGGRKTALKTGPRLYLSLAAESEKRPPFFRVARLIFVSHTCKTQKKAYAAWQWHDFWQSRAPSAETVVRVNMDETAVKLDLQRRSPGFVKAKTKAEKKALRTVRQKLTLREKRAAVTVVAWLCDDARLQQRLPQYIVGNESVLPASVVRTFRQGEGSVFMLRRKSSWLTADTLVAMLKGLAAAIRVEKPDAFVLLSMDACATHLTPKIARAASRLRLHLHLIPACTTRFMQPLDVAVFGEFKLRLYQAYQRRLLASSSGRLSKGDFFELLCEVMADVLRKDWVRAFRRTGFCADRADVSKTLLEAMGQTELETVADSLPSLPALQAVFPRGRYIHVMELFRLAMAAQQRRRVHRAVRVVRSSSSTASVPLRLRLRSARAKRRLARQSVLKQPAPVASLAASAPPPPAAKPCPPATLPAPLRRLPVGRPLGPPRRAAATLSAPTKC